MDSSPQNKKIPTPSELMARLQSLMQSEADINADYSEVLQALVQIEEKQASRQKEIFELKQLLISSMKPIREEQQVEKIYKSGAGHSSSSRSLVKASGWTIDPRRPPYQVYCAEKVSGSLSKLMFMSSTRDLLNTQRKSNGAAKLTSFQNLQNSGTLKTTSTTSTTTNQYKEKASIVHQKNLNRGPLKTSTAGVYANKCTPQNSTRKLSYFNFDLPESSKISSVSTRVLSQSQKIGGFADIDFRSSAVMVQKTNLAPEQSSMGLKNTKTSAFNLSKRFIAPIATSELKISSSRISSDVPNEPLKTFSPQSRRFADTNSPKKPAFSALDRLMQSAPRLLSLKREKSLNLEVLDPKNRELITPRSRVFERSLQNPEIGFKNIYERQTTGEVDKSGYILREVSKSRVCLSNRSAQSASERLLKSKEPRKNLWQSVLLPMKSAENTAEPTAASPVHRCMTSESPDVGNLAQPEDLRKSVDPDLDSTLKTPSKKSGLLHQLEPPSPSASFKGLQQIWEKLSSKYTPEFTEEKQKENPPVADLFDNISQIYAESSQDTLGDDKIAAVADLELDVSGPVNFVTDIEQNPLFSRNTTTKAAVQSKIQRHNKPTSK